MPQIIPIRDLKNTSGISELCHKVDEPIFVTKNGYGDMVIMSIELYEKNMYMNSIYNKLRQAEESIKHGNVYDASKSISSLNK